MAQDAASQPNTVNTKEWVQDTVVKRLSDKDIKENETQIVRFYIFKHLYREGQEFEDGIFSLIQKYSSPLIIRDINARDISNYCLSSDPKWKERYNNCKYVPTGNSKDNNIKLVAVGAGAMGKTSMFITYTHGEFPGEYIPTIFDACEHRVMIDGRPISVGLWDTAGSEDYDRLRPLSYPQTDIFLVCMDVFYGNKRKYDKDHTLTKKQMDALSFVQELRALCSDNVPICIVGMKTDLRYDDKLFDGKPMKDQCWSKEEMEHFAKYYCGCNNYMECSSLNNEGINELFEFAVRGALHCRASLAKKRKNCTIL